MKLHAMHRERYKWASCIKVKKVRPSSKAPFFTSAKKLDETISLLSFMAGKRKRDKALLCFLLTKMINSMIIPR